MKIFSRRPTVDRSTLITSQLSFPPSLYPAQMKMCGMCSLKPAFSYMASHCVLLMMGRSTSWRTAGRGPSVKRRRPGWRLVRPSLVTFIESAPARDPGSLTHQVLVVLRHTDRDDVGLEGDGLVEPEAVSVKTLGSQRFVSNLRRARSYSNVLGSNFG